MVLGPQLLFDDVFDVHLYLGRLGHHAVLVVVDNIFLGLEALDVGV